MTPIMRRRELLTAAALAGTVTVLLLPSIPMATTAQLDFMPAPSLQDGEFV